MGGVGTRGFIALPPGRDDQAPCSCRSRRPAQCWTNRYQQAWQGRSPGAADDAGLQRQPTRVDELCPRDRFFHWRQLRHDALLGWMACPHLTPEYHAGRCGWTLNLAHARSGEPVVLASCLDAGDEFDRSITDSPAARRPERHRLTRHSYRRPHRPHPLPKESDAANQ